MSLDVIDVDERLIPGPSEGFGGTEADQERTDQAGPIGYGNGGYVRGGQAGAVQGLGNDGIDPLDMGTRGDLGDDTAVLGVELVLAGDDAGKDMTAISDDGGGGLVARGLNAQNIDGLLYHRGTPNRKKSEWVIMASERGFVKKAVAWKLFLLFGLDRLQAL